MSHPAINVGGVEGEKRCRLCGNVLAEDPGDEDQDLCGDCYWDDQTNAEGAIDDP